MKLLDKYSAELTDDKKDALMDILTSIDETDSKHIENLLSGHLRKSKSLCYQGDVLNLFEQLKELDTEQSLKMLNSIFKETEKAILLIGMLSILNKYPKKTFDLINETIDFKAYEKRNKVTLSKYFKNKSEAKHKELLGVHSFLSKKAKEMGLKGYACDVISGSISQMISNAMMEKHKKTTNKTALSEVMMLSVVLSEKEFNSVKRFLGLPAPEESNREKYENRSSSYNGTDYYFGEDDIYQIDEVCDYESSLIYAVATSDLVHGAVLKLKSMFKNIPVYHYLNGYSYLTDLPKIDMTESDYDKIRQGRKGILIGNDTSFSAMEKTRRLHNGVIANLNSSTFETLKKWLRNYDENDFLGSVVEIECGNYSTKEMAYSVVSKVYKNNDKNELYVECLVADLLNKTFAFENYPMSSVIKKERLSKMEAMVFYQDAQCLYNM